MSTIGYERRFNDFLQYDNLDEFKQVRRGERPARTAPLQAAQEDQRGGATDSPRPAGRARACRPQEFQAALQKGNAQLVDTRQMLAFGGGHIEGAINIGPRPELSVWAGQMLDADKPILLVVEDETDLDWRALVVRLHRLHEVRRLPGRRHEGVG